MVVEVFRDGAFALRGEMPSFGSDVLHPQPWVHISIFDEVVTIVYLDECLGHLQPRLVCPHHRYVVQPIIYFEHRSCLVLSRNPRSVDNAQHFERAVYLLRLELVILNLLMLVLGMIALVLESARIMADAQSSVYSPYSQPRMTSPPYDLRIDIYVRYDCPENG